MVPWEWMSNMFTFRPIDDWLVLCQTKLAFQTLILRCNLEHVAQQSQMDWFEAREHMCRVAGASRNMAEEKEI